MQPLNALSLAPDANDWLANTHHPHILHVFDQACNLINERREVLSVVTSQIGNGPFNLVVEEDACFAEHLNLQSPISNSVSRLYLGDLNIIITGAKLWSPYPDWEKLHDQRDLLFEGLRFCLSSWKPVEAHSTNTSLQTLLSDLSFALANADIPTALTKTRKLAGLGPGLTPSGDDIILGAVLAVRIVHPLKIARALAEAVTNTAAPLTTSLSAAWLRSAGRGEAGIMWHDFLDALASTDPISIRGAMDKILAVGATSGADALSGFISTCLRWKKLMNTRSQNLRS